MRILLDECVNQRLRDYLPGHVCQSARYAGFGGLKNGELLDATQAANFDEAASDQQVLVFVAPVRCSETCHVGQIRPMRLGTGSERIDDSYRSVCLPVGQVLRVEDLST